MPSVLRHNTLKPILLAHGLYEDFFFDTLMEEPPRTVSQFLNDLSEPAAKALNDYIIHRLAEVDSGYIPKEPIT